MRSLLVVAFVLAAIAACSSYGEEETATPLPERDFDAGVDSNTTPSGGPCPEATCTLPALPAPFTLAIYDSRDNACPDGWLGRDIVERPTASSETCACSACTISASCNTGSIETKYGNTSACANNGLTVPANNGACHVQSAALGQFASATAPAPTNVTCTAKATTDRTKVKVDLRRVCMPGADTCPGTACGKPLCAIATGDVPCPPSLPTRHLVGSDFTATCADCTCTASVTCGGVLMVYDNATCTGTSVGQVPSGSCAMTGGAQFNATKWMGSIQNQSCSPPVAKAATVALTEVATVCCL